MDGWLCCYYFFCGFLCFLGEGVLFILFFLFLLCTCFCLLLNVHENKIVYYKIYKKKEKYPAFISIQDTQSNDDLCQP